MDNYNFEFSGLFFSRLQNSVKSPNAGYWPVCNYSNKMDYYSELLNGHPKNYSPNKTTRIRV
jgi:hypothetical protein